MHARLVVPLRVALLAALASCQTPPPRGGHFAALTTGSTASLRGLHVLDRGTFWASGSGGTVLRSTDGGRTVQVLRVPGEAKGELRDVHAFDARRAVLIACQPARIYRTDDGGASFVKVYECADEKAFLDALAFFDADRGLAFGDPLGDRFQLLRTADGGRSWTPVDPAGMPPVLEGEGGFAASGTCLAAASDGRAWIGTGIGGARVFASRDFGATWTATATPLRHGPSAGVFSVAVRGQRGILVGGDYQKPEAGGDNIAISADGGRTWGGAVRTPPRAYRSCVAAVPGHPGTWVAVGRAGADITNDDGTTWRALDDAGYYVVSFGPDGAGYAAGADGRVARLVLE